jgi:Sec-independent protein translocase protein TatA
VLDITPIKILIVLVVALLVLGPERLPRLAHQVARGWADVRRFRDQIGSEVRETVMGERSTEPTVTNSSGASPPVEPRQTGPKERGPEKLADGGEQPERYHPGLN